jgi:hypothetical protein
MKKLLIFSVVFALMCATVFAEVTVTAGAGASFVPLGVIFPPDDNNPNTDEGPKAVTGFGRNGAASAELQVNVEGKTENGKAGFLFQWRPRVTSAVAIDNQLGDNAGLWLKPLDWIRIDAIKFHNNDLRGKVGNGAWFGDYTIPRADENSIFQRFDGKFAALISVKPEAVAGLSAYAMLNTIKEYAQWNASTWGAQRGAQWVWQNSPIGIGYDISNIGLVRAQFVGAQIPSSDGTIPAADKIDLTKDLITTNSDGKVILNKGLFTSASAAPRIEAAFAFTGLPGLTLDVGGKFWIPVSDPEIDNTNVFADGFSLENYSYWGGIEVGLGVKYAADPLTVNFIIGGRFAASTTDETIVNAKEEKKDGIALKPYVAVAYKLNDTFTAQVEGGLVFTGDGETTQTAAGTTTTTTVDGNVRYGFGVGLQTTLAPSCTIRTGITFAGGNKENASGVKQDKGVLSIPIIFSVAF